MKFVERRLFTAVALTAACAASPASATALRRAALEDLVARNHTIVVGKVLEVHSYWNKTRTFILSDVRVAAREVVKGDVTEKELTVTLMGGTVGEKTVLIIAGPQLEQGKSYVLFVDRGNLPGAPAVRTIRGHAQGLALKTLIGSIREIASRQANDPAGVQR